jgi:tetratricopeptide (TPR) repeat protein
VETQARWNDPEELFLPLWLSYLTQLARPSALEILDERLDDYPEDIWTLRTMLTTFPPDRRHELCDSLTEDALSFPDDPNKAFLRVRCIEDNVQRSQSYLELLDEYPENPFLNRAVGLYYFGQGTYSLAYQYMKKAFYLEPRVMLSDMDFLARLSLHQEENTAVISSEIGPWSPHIRKLLSLGSPPEPGDEDGIEAALAHLEAGEVEEAVKAAGPVLSMSILYFCAASDNAPRKLVQEAITAPPLDYLSVHNAWSALGLFLREKQNTTLVEGFILDNALDRDHAMTAIDLVKSQKLDELDNFMLGLDPWLQGNLALATHISMGGASPARYVEIARGFLFVGERPYLGPH